jgi:hypothetical protein
MMRVAQEILGAAPWLVFGVWTNFRSRRERLPDPSGYIFETPLKRLGNLPDYHLPTELGVTDVRQKA